MALRRSRFVATDARTGRLERAVAMINDGQNPALRVLRSEADQYNPQSKRVRVPPDRVALLGKAWIDEPMAGPLDIQIGYWAGGAQGSNWQRPSMPSMVLAFSGGYASSSGSTYGFGRYGYGAEGYGGSLQDEEWPF